jgi:predicted RNase H-like HicB family nuclease
MNREFNVIIEKDEEGFYVATVPALKGCHTQAKSLDELIERTKEAIELCLEEETDIVYPFDFVGVQKISVKEKPVKYQKTRTRK